MLTRFIIFPVFLILLSSCAGQSVRRDQPKAGYSYAELKLKDVDEMLALVKENLAGYQKTKDEQVLQKTLAMILARPNTDNILERVLLSFRLGLDSNEQWESVVEKLVDRAISGLKSPTESAADQVNYAFVLQNLMVEFVGEFRKPGARTKFERHIIEKVSKSDIIISEDAVNEADLNMVGRAVSPSEIGKEILAELDAEKKAEKSLKK